MSGKILREQKKEYSDHLFELINEPFIRIFQQIYNECLLSKPPAILKMFQKKLSEIPEWNQIKVKSIYDDIISRNKCTYFPDLIKTVYTVTIKNILFGVSPEKRKNMKFKIPTSEAFVHRCLIHIARELWKRPYLFYHKTRSIDCQNNIHQCENIIRKKINIVIRETIPMEWLVSQYNNSITSEEQSKQVSFEQIKEEEEPSSSSEEEVESSSESEKNVPEQEEAESEPESEEAESESESEEEEPESDKEEEAESEEAESDKEEENEVIKDDDKEEESESESENEVIKEDGEEEDEQLVKDTDDSSISSLSDEEDVKTIDITDRQRKKSNKDAFF